MNRSESDTPVRYVVVMASRKIHRATCRFVRDPGSPEAPYADETAIRVLDHCKVCKP